MGQIPRSIERISSFLKNCRKVQTRSFVYIAEWWRRLRTESKHAACFYLRTALNLIFGTFSAQF